MNQKKSTAKILGELLKNEAKNNPAFYLFSPDETTSNKLDAIYDTASRAWSSLPTKAWDMKESDGGQIVELLSENVLFATMLGHILAGEPAMMTSYEAFFSVITSQIIQHLKFLDQSEKVSWREKYPAVNLLSTSTCWRQDHNGFSHQSPILISTLLDRPGNKVNCFFPVDSESMRSVYKFMMDSKNVVNLVTFNKTEEPQYIDEIHAEYQFQNGASIFGFASDGDTFYLDSDENRFDFIFTAAGDIATRETLEAMKLVREDFPELRLRFVNILSLTHEKIGTTEHPLSQEMFDKYFKQNPPIIANFHGYKETLKHILRNYTNVEIFAHGFEEQGTTTTPLEMLTLNHASRYDLALDVARKMNRSDIVKKYEEIISKNREHAREFGVDLFEI
jgi:xylulose-5-phosphate/fructose-6-phosphate phosphoketolase